MSITPKIAIMLSPLSMGKDVLSAATRNYSFSIAFLTSNLT